MYYIFRLINIVLYYKLYIIIVNYYCIILYCIIFSFRFKFIAHVMNLIDILSMKYRYLNINNNYILLYIVLYYYSILYNITIVYYILLYIVLYYYCILYCHVLY